MDLSEDERDNDVFSIRFDRTDDDVLLVIVMVKHHDIPETTYKKLKKIQKRFVRTMEVAPVPYHFVFDFHEVTVLPTDAVLDMIMYVGKRRHVLMPYHMSSSYITNGRAMEGMVRGILSMFTAWAPYVVLHHKADEDTWRGCRELWQSTRCAKDVG